MYLHPQTSISNIKAGQWHDSNNPLASYLFLSLFESAQVTCTENGWQPLHLCLYQDADKKHLLAVMPTYVKAHSYGEYVFDWAWASYYDRIGLDYYPKLLTATPLTPCLAPKLLGDLTDPQLNSWLTSIIQWLEQSQLSSWHINFPEKTSAEKLKQFDFLERLDIQFHWKNQDYQSFDDFLAKLKPKKRRNISQERRKVQAAGWTFSRKLAKDISEEEWQLFYNLYTHTFAKKAGWAQLNLDFFKGLTAGLPEAAMVVFAYQSGEIKAASLFFISDTHLYGRYWGAFEQTDGLHFETCYYQGIEYAIEHQLQVFEPGAQGEHKLARGFEPVTTHSYHYIVDEQHRPPIAAWVQQEKQQVHDRLDYYQAHSAYH